MLLVHSIYSLESPVSSLSADEVADPSQDGAEKKVWINILQVYGQFRQTAKALLKDIDAVMDLAWSAQKQLESIEAVANRVESISQYIEDYKYEGATQLVKDMEEGVFQQSDLLLFQDVPNIKTCYDELALSRDKILTLGLDQSNTVYSTSKLIFDATASQFKRIFGTTTEPQSIQQALNQKTASATIASHTANQVSLDNQNNQITKQTEEITDAAGNITPDILSSSHLAISRNQVLINYQYHEYEADKIQNLALILLEKSRRLDNIVHNKEVTVKSFRSEVGDSK